MPGDLTQGLYLGYLPSGLTFTITEVKTIVPDNNGWVAEFSHPESGKVTTNSSGTHDSLSLPIPISSSKESGLIAHTKLTGDSGMYSSESPGGKIEIAFQIDGTAHVNGRTASISDACIGSFTISSTEWQGLYRPDYSVISYCWNGSAPGVATVRVPATLGSSPNDGHFIFAVDVNTGVVGMNFTTRKEILEKAVEYAEKGSLWVDGGMSGWGKKLGGCHLS